MTLSNITDRGTLRGVIYRGAGSGTTDYTQLSNKPQINGHTLQGNQSGDDLDLIDKGSIIINSITVEGNHTGDYYKLINDADLKINEGWAGTILHNIKFKNTTYTVYASPFSGASSGVNGTMGLVPAPLSSQGDYDKFLKGNGQWASVSGGIDYSYNEQDTSLKWVDNKDIYQITITGTKGTSDTYHVMPSGFSDNEIIDIEGVLEASSGDVVKLGYFNSINDRFNGYFNKANNRFVIFGSSLQGTYKLTFKYVKP